MAWRLTDDGAAGDRFTAAGRVLPKMVSVHRVRDSVLDHMSFADNIRSNYAFTGVDEQARLGRP